MVVEVDQSGRVEDLAMGTAVAFSNGSNGAVYISAGEKRQIVYLLKRNPHYSLNFAALFFAILVFIVLENKEFPKIVIDEEYSGKEEFIKDVIVKYCKRFGGKAPSVNFGNIGKLAPAHRLAWKVHKLKGKIAGVRHLTALEIIKLLKK